jgi:hypothetical protein
MASEREVRVMNLEGGYVLPGFRNVHAHLDDLYPGVNNLTRSGSAIDWAIRAGRNAMVDTRELNYPGVWRAITATRYDLQFDHELKVKGNLIETLPKAFHLCDRGIPIGLVECGHNLKGDQDNGQVTCFHR